MNRALMAAGLVNHMQVPLFPVITRQTGLTRFSGAPLISTLNLSRAEHSTANIRELYYKPTLHA